MLRDRIFVVVFAVTFAFFPKPAIAQQLSWATQGGAPVNQAQIVDVKVSNTGMTYAIGLFTGSIVIGQNILSGTDQHFLVKYNNVGNVEWARTFNAQATTALTIDHNSNVSVFGYSSSNSIFGLVHSQGFYVVQLDSLGAEKWIYDFENSAGQAKVVDVSVDEFSNIYAIGSYNGIVNIGGSTFNNFNNNAVMDYFIAKWDSAGSLLWAKRSGATVIGSSEFIPSALAIGNTGNIIITGGITGKFVFVGTDTIQSQGPRDLFIVKYDAQGRYVFGFNDGLTNLETSTALALDENENIYLSGYYTGTNITTIGGQILVSGTGSRRCFIAKFDSVGTFTALRQVGGADHYPHSLTYSDGSLYYASQYQNSKLYSFDVDLNPIWNFTVTGNTSSNFNYPLSIASNTDALIVGGYYEGIAEIEDSTFTASGQNDFYLAKFSLCHNQPITLQPNAVTFCQGDSALITINGTTQNNVNWYYNGQLVPNESSDTLIVFQAGTYFATAYYRPNCISSSDTASFNVVNNPNQPAFSLTDSICITDSAIVIFGTPNGGVFAGGGVTGNMLYPNSLNDGSNLVTYTITDSNGCSSSITKTIIGYVCDTTTSIVESQLQHLDIYPNPCYDMLILRFGNSHLTKKLKLYNAIGLLVDSYSIDPNAIQSVIYLSQLSKGIYLIQLTDENAKLLGTQRVIKN